MENKKLYGYLYYFAFLYFRYSCRWEKRDSNTIVDAIRENYLKYFAPAEIVREEKIGKLDADGKPVVKKALIMIIKASVRLISESA